MFWGVGGCSIMLFVIVSCKTLHKDTQLQGWSTESCYGDITSTWHSYIDATMLRKQGKITRALKIFMCLTQPRQWFLNSANVLTFHSIHFPILVFIINKRIQNIGYLFRVICVACNTQLCTLYITMCYMDLAEFIFLL